MYGETSEDNYSLEYKTYGFYDPVMSLPMWDGISFDGLALPLDCCTTVLGHPINKNICLLKFNNRHTEQHHLQWSQIKILKNSFKSRAHIPLKEHESCYVICVNIIV